MAEIIQWDAEILNPELDQIRESAVNVEGTERVSYDLSYGMEVMECMSALQANLQELLELYIGVLKEDLDQVSAVLTQVYETDSAAAERIAGGNIVV